MPKNKCPNCTCENCKPSPPWDHDWSWPDERTFLRDDGLHVEVREDRGSSVIFLHRNFGLGASKSIPIEVFAQLLENFNRG